MFENEQFQILHGNAIDVLKTLPDESVNCCVTSPPYYALRDYMTGHWEGGDPNCPHYRTSKKSDKTITGHKAMSEHDSPVGDAIYKSVCPLCGAVRVDEQIGLEETPQQYISRLVEVFHEVKRVLKNDGTLWINIGDSYWGSGSRGFDFTNTFSEKSKIQQGSKGTTDLHNLPSLTGNFGDYKNKDLIGIPWMLAFALRADGWYLRQDIIWAKPNPMPESVKDRCTKSHEYIFLLTKQPNYYFDAESIQVEAKEVSVKRSKYGFNTDHPSAGINGIHVEEMGSRFVPKKKNHKNIQYNGQQNNTMHELRAEGYPDKEYYTANKRDVWTVNVGGGYSDPDGSHYATYNVKLIEPCILAGSPMGGVILDPFNGTGTTGASALSLARKYIGIDLSEKYVRMAQKRLQRISDQSNLFDLM